MHFVSIPTVPEMHVFLSRIGKHMHSNGHLEHQKMHFMSTQTVPEMASKCIHMVICKHLNAFREHSNCLRNAFASESDWHFNGD